MTYLALGSTEKVGVQAFKSSNFTFTVPSDVILHFLFFIPRV